MRQSTLDKAVYLSVLLVVAWAPVSRHIQRTDAGMQYLAVSVPACALILFVLYLIVHRFRGGQWGRRLELATLFMLGAFGVTYVVNGGVLGQPEMTRFYPARFLLFVCAAPAAYHVARLDLLSPEIIKKLSSFVTILLLVSMAVAWEGSVEAVHAYRGVDRIPTLNGTQVPAYVFAFALPGLFLIRRQLPRYLLAGTACMAILVTYRRGPTLCALAAIGVFFVFSNAHLLKKVAGLAVVASLITFACWRIGTEVLFLRWFKLYDGSSMSCRDRIYPIMIDGIFENVNTFFIGHGVGATTVANGLEMGRPVFAHNDWLEMTYTAGLFGFVAFLSLHVCFLFAVFRVAKSKKNMAAFCSAIYAQFFCSNITEGVIYSSHHGVFMSILIGCTFALADEAAAPRHCARQVSREPDSTMTSVLNVEEKSGNLAIQPQFASWKVKNMRKSPKAFGREKV